MIVVILKIFLAAIERIISMDVDEIDSLKKNALNTAESFFDGGLYLDVLNKVVNESK